MKTLIFSDNSRTKVKSETDRYWITDKSQFSKANPNIVAVVEDVKKEKKSTKKEEVAEETAEETEKGDK